MRIRPSIHDFIEQELQVAQQLFATVVDAVLDAWRIHAPTRIASDLNAPRVLHQHRDEFAHRAAASLREQTQRKIGGAKSTPRKTERQELALVDDDEVSTDIEIARVVERANATLENELRSLRTYTSALVGDVNTSRDTNPLRPEVWVRALMVAVRDLPIPRTMQTALLRSAADPLIRAIRDTYLGGCARLQAQGVEPAAHRTLVNEGVTIELTDATRARRELERKSGETDFQPPRADSGNAPLSRYQVTTAIDGLLDQLEQGLAGNSRGFSDAQGAQRDGLIGATSDAREQRSIERLSQLFDSILSDRRLPRDSLPLLSRLYPSALRQALGHAQLLDDWTHPLWRFMDQLAFLMQTRAVGDPHANVAFAQNLVEQMVGHPALEVRQFQSTVDRLAVHERQRFARAVAAANREIVELTAHMHQAGGESDPSVPQALDAGGLDSQTTPLLRRATDTKPAEPTPPEQWRPGTWLTIFVRGQWRRALVLWRAPAPGPWLLLDATEARHWALRRRSLERLCAEGLARELSARSLMRDAIGRIGRMSRTARDPGPTLFG
jgi:hypothetical protein